MYLGRSSARKRFKPRSVYTSNRTSRLYQVFGRRPRSSAIASKVSATALRRKPQPKSKGVMRAGSTWPNCSLA